MTNKNVSLDGAIYARLQSFAAYTGVSCKFIADAAVTKWLETYEERYRALAEPSREGPYE